MHLHLDYYPSLVHGLDGRLSEASMWPDRSLVPRSESPRPTLLCFCFAFPALQTTTTISTRSEHRHRILQLNTDTFINHLRQSMFWILDLGAFSHLSLSLSSFSRSERWSSGVTTTALRHDEFTGERPRLGCRIRRRPPRVPRTSFSTRTRAPVRSGFVISSHQGFT